MLAHPIQHSANGIRTRVWALRGPRPSPLDDSANAPVSPAVPDPRNHNGSFSKRALDKTISQRQARQESNLQPPVLETGALPIELRT